MAEVNKPKILILIQISYIKCINIEQCRSLGNGGELEAWAMRGLKLNLIIYC